MRATGIVRRIDDLGRVVIPKEIRKNLKIREGDPLEIFVENDMVCFQRYSENTDYKEAIKPFLNEIEDVRYNGYNGETTVVFCDDTVSRVTKDAGDEFDINAAIFYALKKKGYCVK